MKNLLYADALAFFKNNPEALPFLNGLHGLEKESLRITPDGNLALTPHPKGLSPSMTYPHITTDFSESQLELITPPHETPQETLSFLKGLHQEAYSSLENDELIWPMSMPARLPATDLIPIARYGDSPEAKKKETYRRALALRYGKMMQTISGVHYNFSFGTELWAVLARLCKDEQSKEFQNDAHMDVVRNFLRLRWMLVYLFGASPQKDLSYTCKKMDIDSSRAVSLRLSRCGYSNPAKIEVSFNSFQEHIRDIRKAVDTPYEPYTALGLVKDGVPIQLNDHLLQLGNEYYASIRVKPPRLINENLLESLEELGSGYFEVRLFDLDPFSPVGVTLDQMQFTHLFLTYCLLKESPTLSYEESLQANTLQQDIALYGQDLPDELRGKGRAVFAELKPLADLLGYETLLTKMSKEWEDPVDVPWKKILDTQKQTKEAFMSFGLRKAREHQATFKRA